MEPAPPTTPTARAAESELFREQAIIAAAGSQFGDPLDTYWRGVAWFIGLSISLVAALAVMLLVVRYSPMHPVPAFVDVPAGLVRISAPADSRVARIAIEEGARVQAGDVLAVLNDDLLGADGGSRGLALRRGYASERDSLAREILLAREEAATQRARTARMLAGMRIERTALLADLQAGTSLLASLREQSRQVAAAADKGYVSRSDAARKRDEALLQESRLALSRSALARIERDIEAAGVDARISDARLRALIERHQRSRDELARTSQVAAVEAEQVIRAPVTGVVSSALVAPGQSVAAGEPMFALVEEGAPLVVRLLVPPRAAGTVRKGTRTRVSFAAYPREKFGEFQARVDRVSASPLLPRELQTFANVSEPAYLATATLLAPPLGPDKRLLGLKPGMLATALVPIEERSAMAWLFDPIIRGFNESAGLPAATGTP
jgi:membrane fusion protein